MQREFVVRGMRFAAQQWGDPNGLPVIALHGWLDNSASFETLSRHIKGCNIVALDMAGHGLSDHRAEHANYHIWGDLLDVLAIADVLAWPKFSLLGHSRGAMAATLLSAAEPSRVEKLVAIDSLLPVPFEAKNAADQLSKFVKSHRRLLRIKMPSYPSKRDAIAALRKSTGISEASALMLSARGLFQDGQRYRWRSDPKLTRDSAFKLTASHNESIIHALECDTLLLLAEQGEVAHRQYFSECAGLNSRIRVEKLAGCHHLHMEQQVLSVAELVNQFFMTSV